MKKTLDIDPYMSFRKESLDFCREMTLTASMAWTYSGLSEAFKERFEIFKSGYGEDFNLEVFTEVIQTSGMRTILEHFEDYLANTKQL